MSSMLRSLRLAHRLSLGRAERRLGSGLVHRAVLPLATINLDRNYVTRAIAARVDFTGYNLINQKLNDIDQRIKNFVLIYKKDIDEVLKIIEKDGQLNSTQALMLIRCCGEFLFNETLQTRRALINEIWSIIKKLEVQLDVSHYNALLLVNLENEVDFSPLDILLEMKDKQIEPNRVTFQRLIEQYCNKGDIAGATKILEHMNQHDIPINEKIFIILMKGHSNAGDTVSALKLLDVMKQAGIEPSSNAYSGVMSVHAKTGDVVSIMKVLNECKEKDILISDADILDIIYTLTINNHSEHVDEFLYILQKGAMYNKVAVTTIHKLLEKGQDEVAYKLLKTLIKNKLQAENDVGHFFIRKLVLIDTDVKKVIKYCKLMKEQKLNNSGLQTAIHATYTNNKHHMAFPFLQELKNTGGEIREQFFYPILTKFSSENNLQDLYKAVKVITNDFEITLNITTIKDYIISNVTGNYITLAEKLSVNGLPFIPVAHAIVIHLLENNKLPEAYKFMCNTNMWYRTKLLSPSIVHSFMRTKDVESFVNILHFLNSKSNEENESQTKIENKDPSLNILVSISDIVAKSIQEITPNDVNVVEQILQGLMAKGININEDAASKIKNHLQEKLNPKLEEVLIKLVSTQFKRTPIDFNKNREHYNINYKYKLNYLKEKAKEFTEFKMILILEHAKMKNKLEVEKLLKELEQQNPNYTAAFCISMFDYYSVTNEIVEADNWYKRLHESHPDCKIDKTKLLHYARILVRNKRPEDALKVLEHPVTDETVEKDELSAKLLTEVLHYCPDNVENVFNLLKRHGYFVKLSTGILGPLVKVHLTAGEVDKAIEKFEWCCKTYNFAPYRRQIMKELIIREDAKTLQHVTDLITRIQDEIQALHDLAFAFFECDKPRQARKILETPGLRLRIHYILKAAEAYSEDTKVERLESFVELFKGLYVDLNPLYCLLLNRYEKLLDWEKCLALWTQMQEDNVQPSSKFMFDLERILKKFNQPVPFTLSHTSSEFSKEFHDAFVQKNLEKASEIVRKIPKKEKPFYLLQLIHAYAGENDTTKAVQYIDELIDTNKVVEPEYFDTFSSVLIQLSKKDDFPTIVKVLKKIQEVSRKQRGRDDRTMGYFGVVNEAYLESGQFAKFIDHLDNLLKQFENGIVKTKNFLNPGITNVMIKGLERHPELEDRFKEYALNAANCNYHKPISALWIHQLTKDSPEAEKTWNQYLSHTQNVYPVSAALVCIERKAFDKIPIIVEKVQQQQDIPFFEKRKMFSAILRILLDSDCPQKYDIAFECLRHASKIMDIYTLNHKLVNQIQENVTKGQTIESLKMENERTKTEVTG